MLKIIDNRDKELMETAEEALKDMKTKYGKRFCPCALELTEDYICPCQPFRNQDYAGECNCGRYEKIMT